MVSVSEADQRDALIDSYKALGFTEHQGKKLSEVPFLSLASVREVLLKGCPVNICYRIFRP